MRIAEISTLSRSVPPKGEGSVESLVSAITESLVERGHDVTLFATADSQTRATLRSPVETSYTATTSGGGSKWDWRLYESYQAREAFRAGAEFDVIHCHAYHFGLLYCDFTATPSLHSFHVEPGPDCVFLAQRVHNRRLHFASRWQARDFESCSGVHVAPHGIKVEDFTARPRDEREDYLVFLGRFLDEKGPLEAIELARRSGMPLKMAAPHNEYYEQKIRPHVDGGLVQYLGEVNPKQKAELLSRARALVYPIQRPEPFGLVLLEAMACGLPALALNCGAVPEIIEHGKTGWIADDLDGLVAGINHLDEFEPSAIRRHAEENFSHHKMMDRLEALLVETAQERKD